MKNIFIFVITAALISGCAGAELSLNKKAKSQTESMFVKASVVQATDSQAVLSVMPLPENGDKSSPISSLTSKILALTYLSEGAETTVNGKTVTVSEKRGDTIIIRPSAGLKPNDTAELYIPKKTLIMSDFKVLDNSKNMTGKLAFGEFSEKLTNSGRYIVLERKELAGIMQEYALELKGLTDPEQASLLGKLLKADLMLTGEMTKAGFNCIFDIRAIDTATSRILGVARESTLCSKIADTSQIRSTSTDYGNFETTETKGWMIGDIQKFNGRTVLDSTTGANGTANSLMLTVDNKGDNTSGIVNKMQRDLSGFETLTFWAKADRPMTGVFFIDDNDEDPKSDKFDRWVADFWLTTEWKKYTIILPELVIAVKKKADADMNKGDKKFSPNMVKLSGFIFPKHKNKEISSAKIWIDELSFR